MITIIWDAIVGFMETMLAKIDKYGRDILWLIVIGLILLSWAIEAAQ